MKDILKSAVTLSIISNPAKLGLWKNISLPPGVILKQLKLSDLITQEIIEKKYSKNPDKASDLIIERCIRQKIRIITIWDSEYPQLLKEIHNPPLVLYSIGDLAANRMISIVGTRDSDIKSDEIARKISVKASISGYTIVSGMALGIDRNAHIGALDAGGSTIAVLPGGVDMIYPSANIDIYKMITASDNSAVISEYPPGTGTAQKWTFAKRNRIISGMSEAVIVIQAPLKSGAMITARYAIEQNRDLLVCPGNAFDDKYSGCHELIREGAAIFTDMSDLFSGTESCDEVVKNKTVEKKENLNYVKNKGVNESEDKLSNDVEFTGKVEKKIYEEIKTGVINVDEFIRKNNFSTDEVNQGITMLEIGGFIERRGNSLYKT